MSYRNRTKGSNCGGVSITTSAQPSLKGIHMVEWEAQYTGEILSSHAHEVLIPIMYQLFINGRTVQELGSAPVLCLPSFEEWMALTCLFLIVLVWYSPCGFGADKGDFMASKSWHVLWNYLRRLTWKASCVNKCQEEVGFVVYKVQILQLICKHTQC